MQLLSGNQINRYMANMYYPNSDDLHSRICSQDRITAKERLSLPTKGKRRIVGQSKALLMAVTFVSLILL